MGKKILYIMMFILFCNYVYALTLVQPPDPNHVWTFNDNASDSVGTFEGTPSGADFNVSGKLGNAVSFDANTDLIDINQDYELTGDFSICMWVDPDICDGSQDQLMIWKGNGYGIGQYDAIDIDNKWMFAIFNAGWHYVKGTSTIQCQWTFVCAVREGNEMQIWVNADNEANTTWAGNPTNSATDLFLNYGSGVGLIGELDETIIWETEALNYSVILSLNNSGQGWAYPWSELIYFTIRASDFYNGSSLLSFNATVNGTLYTTTNGTIVTNYTNNSIVNVSMIAENYMERNYSNVDTNFSLSTELIPNFVIYNISYDNYVNIGETNYTRTLNISVNATCLNNSDTRVYFLINSEYKTNFSMQCDESPNLLSISYQNSEETNYSHKVEINNSDYSYSENQNYFYYDLYSPNISVNVNFSTGFTSGYNASLYCNDSVSPNLNYTLYYNSNLILNASNITRGQNLSNASNTSSRTNLFEGYCYDLFGSSNENTSETVYWSNILLINEYNGSVFNHSNLTAVRLILGNNTIYNFKTEDTSDINVTTISNTTLRLELEYPSGAIVTRHIDMTLLQQDQIGLCCNDVGTTHYNMILLSASEKEVLVRNSFVDCYIYADYTRFAYSTSYIGLAYTKNSLYYLHTFDSGSPIYLASIDGSIETTINLDNLEFSKTSYNFTNIGDGLAIERTGTGDLKVYYLNPANDNTDLRLTIENTNTSTTYLDLSNFTDQDTFTLYFNTATLGINNNELIKFTVYETKSDGSVLTIVKYALKDGSVGNIRPEVAISFMTIIILLGLTSTVSSLGLTWFGAIAGLAALAVGSLATQTWYIKTGEVFSLIFIIYSLIAYFTTNKQELVR